MGLVSSPPVLDGVNSQVGGVTGGRHAHVPFIAFRIVDSLWRRPAFRVSWKIVIVDLLRFPTPRLAWVFELADEFLFLRIHADSWITTLAEIPALLVKVPKLSITLRMLLTRVQYFAVAPQTVLLVSQQTADRRRTGAVAQLLRQCT